MNQEISMFGALFIILLSFEFFIPLRQLGSFFHIAMNGIAASEKIFKVLDLNAERVSSLSLDNRSIDIRCDHLSFSYQKDRQTLKNVSLKIEPQQFVGIVGQSGSW